MIRNRSSWAAFWKYTRLTLAVFLLAGLASTAAPLITNASGTVCTLSCCAGRAPHAAGSCMSGACHAFLHRSQSTRSHVHLQPAEHYCGLDRFDKAAQTATSRIRTTPGHETIRLRGAFTSPCEADCRTCGATFGNFYHGRNFAIAAYRPEALTGQRQLDLNAGPVLTCSAHSKGCAPRGPPKHFT